MRVLVCGGRDFGAENTGSDPINPELCAQWNFGMRFLKAKFGEGKGVTIISGGATGADALGEDYTLCSHAKLEHYPADWSQYGKKAGYIRNQQMLDEGKPDLVIAFPGGKGTAMMVELAKKAGVEVIEVQYDQTR